MSSSATAGGEDLAAGRAASHAGSDSSPGSGFRLPPGRRIELAGRGKSFYREVAGPPGAPTLLLLHGWIASAGLNWFRCFDVLSRHFRVIAPDLRGHGRGIRSWRRFRLSDCADDAEQLLRQLDTGPVIAVGYSMGGAVGQMLWKRHRARVAGLVLSATGHHLVVGARERFVFTSAMSALAGTMRLGQLSALLPRRLVESLLPRSRAARPSSLGRWAAAEMARHDWRMLLEAGYSLGYYDARAWIGKVDVPTAVLIHTQDRTLSPELQLRMAIEIPDASIHRLDDGHAACANPSYAAPLLAACLEVARRAAGDERRRTRS